MHKINVLKLGIILNKLILTGIALFSAAFFYAWKIEPNWLQIKKETIFLDNLPASFNDFKIVQLSDLHGKKFPDKKLVKIINHQKPDIVIITGDIFDRDKKIQLDYAKDVFQGIHPPYGAFFVFGNNDYYLDREKICQQLKSFGIKVLANENHLISLKGQDLWVIGVEDPVTRRANLEEAMTGIKKGPKILLAHSPEVIYKAEKKGIDLILAGHTHGGQIYVPFMPRYLPHIKKSYRSYISGLYKTQTTQVYVNPGLGEGEIPLRFMVRPQVTVFTLRNK